MPKGVYIRTKPFSYKHRRKLSTAHAKLIGTKSSRWAGNKISKNGIHTWLGMNYKKTGICKFCCNKFEVKGHNTEWALIKRRKYKRKRENFIELCRKCHVNYDGNHYKAGHKAWNKGIKTKINPYDPKRRKNVI